MTSRRLGTIAALVATTASCALLAASPASATPSNTDSFSNGTDRSLCLDADANAGAGAHVNTVTCNGSDAQKWQIGTVGTETIWINAAHAGLALAATSLGTGAALVLEPVNGSDPAQNWEYFGTDADGYVISNRSNTSLALDAAYGGGSVVNGRQVQVGAYNGGFSNQAWYDTHHA